MEPPPPPLSLSIGDEKEDMEQAVGGSEHSIEEQKNSGSSEQTPPNRLCRICYAPEDASEADPILLLGCACKGDDISYGHQSCLKKWFCMRLRRNGKLDCEVCRRPLGVRLRRIIRSFIIAEVIQHAPRFLLLLRIPPHDLDHLQVPLATPDFYQLPSATRRSVEASFARLEQDQRRGQSRRREAFETAQLQNLAAAAADREHMSSVSQLEDMLFNDFLELSEVRLDHADENPPIIRVFSENPHPQIHTSYQAEADDAHLIVYPEGPVLRVPIFRPEDRMHPTPEEVLLDEVSRQAVRVVDLYGEDLILLPNYLDNLFLELRAEPLLTLSADSEIHDNVDEIPIAIPVLVNPTSGGPDPAFAEEAAAAAPATDSTPSRLYTYGRFRMFHLLQNDVPN